MVPASELLQIQADAAALLDKSCTIQRKTRMPDGAGSSTEVYTTTDTVNAGLAQPTAGQLANYAFLIGSLKAWQVKLPVTSPNTHLPTDVQHQDHLVIDGQALEVQVVLTPRSYQALLVVLASEVQ
ncbi:MAG: phage head completion protein [Ktedonobacteraceae bacterium]